MGLKCSKQQEHNIVEEKSMVDIQIESGKIHRIYDEDKSTKLSPDILQWHRDKIILNTLTLTDIESLQIKVNNMFINDAIKFVRTHYGSQHSLTKERSNHLRQIDKLHMMQEDKYKYGYTPKRKNWVLSCNDDGLTYEYEGELYNTTTIIHTDTADVKKFIKLGDYVNKDLVDKLDNESFVLPSFIGEKYCMYDVHPLIKQCDRTTDNAILLMYDIAVALNKIHNFKNSNGYNAYNDLKPLNIVKSNKIKQKFMLCDLDSICLQGITYEFCSPEFFDGKHELRTKHDIYCLGLTVYWMLGKNREWVDIPDLWIYSKLRFLYKLNYNIHFDWKNVPIWLTTLLKSMLDFNPENRPTAEHILSDIHILPYLAARVARNLI